jgi:hypothetical protein
MANSRHALAGYFVLLLVFFLTPVMAQGMVADSCPMRIDVAKNGDFFTNRFYGHYKTSPKLLESDLKSGCYNDSNPANVSSVTIKIAPGAPTVRTELLYRILERNGWPKSKVSLQQ